MFLSLPLKHVCLLAFLPGNNFYLYLCLKIPDSYVLHSPVFPTSSSKQHCSRSGREGLIFSPLREFHQPRIVEDTRKCKSNPAPSATQPFSRTEENTVEYSETCSKPEQANITDAICHSLETVFPASLYSRQPECICLKGSKGVFYRVMLYQCFLCRKKHLIASVFIYLFIFIFLKVFICCFPLRILCACTGAFYVITETEVPEKKNSSVSFYYVDGRSGNSFVPNKLAPLFSHHQWD